MKAFLVTVLTLGSVAHAEVNCTVMENVGDKSENYKISADSAGIRDLKKFQLKLFPDRELQIAKIDDSEYVLQISSVGPDGLSYIAAGGSGHLVLQSMGSGLVRAECTNAK